MSKLTILGLIRANVQKIQSFTFTDVSSFLSSNWFKCPHCWDRLWYIQGVQKLTEFLETIWPFFHFFCTPCFCIYGKWWLQWGWSWSGWCWWGCSLGTGGAGTALTGWWECPHISYIELHRNIARVYFQKYFFFPWTVFVVYAISNCTAT